MFPVAQHGLETNWREPMDAVECMWQDGDTDGWSRSRAFRDRSLVVRSPFASGQPMPCPLNVPAFRARSRLPQARGSHVPPLVLACLAALPACLGTTTQTAARRITTDPFAQEQSAAAEQPWAQGFAPVPGVGSGKSLTLRHESTTIDIDDKDSLKATVHGDVDFDLAGLQYAFAAGACLYRVTLATVACENRVPDEGSDAGAFGGVAVAFPIARMGRFVWAGDAGFHGGLVDWQQPAFGDTSVGWFQYDLRAGCAYAPAPTSSAAIAPRAALGVRAIDGIQDLGDGGTTDFDAVAPYALLGVGAHMRTGARSRLSLDLHGLVGDVQGFEFAISFQF
jgi:hypothetical protein